MKKIYLLVMVLLVSCTIGFVPSANATDSKDQGCANTNPTSYEAFEYNAPYNEQGFRPAQNRLSYVVLKIGGIGLDGGEAIRLRILNYARDSVLGESTILPTISGSEQRRWDFSPAVTLTPNERYILRLENYSQSGAFLYWYTAPDSCYLRGSAEQGGSVMGFDFDFASYGYTYTTSVSPSSVPASSTTTATSVPKTTVSADIKAPTEPKATYDAVAKVVNLSWKASATTDIEGYIVSRSEDNKTFTDLGTVKKDVLTYQDKSIAQEKTYYYQIKAYKGTKSSAVSSTTSVVIPKPGEEAVTANTDEPARVEVKSASFWNLENSLLMSGGILIVLLVITLGVLIYLRKKKNLSFGKVLRFKKVK